MAIDETSAIADDIRESIALSSLNSISGQPANLSNLSFGNTLANVNLSHQNTVANQQAANQVALSVLGNAVDLVANLDPMEAVATVKLDTGNDLAQQIADLKAAFNSFNFNRGDSGGNGGNGGGNGGNGGGNGGNGGNVPNSPPGPQIEPNPSGGTTITLTEENLPTELTVET